jgi:ADP-ribosylation factor-like protein 1
MSSSAPALPDVLVMGASGGGKSVLVARAEHLARGRTQPAFVATRPTVGIEHATLPVARVKLSLTLREIGGAMETEWPALYARCAAVVFVVDISDTLRLPDAAVMLFDLMSETWLASRPFLIVLNKTDMPSAMARGTVDAVLRLADLVREHPGKITIIESSAMTGRGVPEIVTWCAEEAFRTL